MDYNNIIRPAINEEIDWTFLKGWMFVFMILNAYPGMVLPIALHDKFIRYMTVYSTGMKLTKRIKSTFSAFESVRQLNDMLFISAYNQQQQTI